MVLLAALDSGSLTSFFVFELAPLDFPGLTSGRPKWCSLKNYEAAIDCPNGISIQLILDSSFASFLRDPFFCQDSLLMATRS